ncbi:MAG: septum formation initiator family protein [Alphaproteobacteria bacterium]|nr:septum formation initiator family protein [Alphaproteobacteria bacterium]
MIPKRTWQMIASVIGACIVGYFLYHTVEGDHGLVAQMHLQNEVDAAQEKLSRLQTERETLQHRTQLLRPGSLDPDLLDEEARKTLNYSKPGEIVILSPKENSDPAPKQ